MTTRAARVGFMERDDTRSAGKSKGATQPTDMAPRKEPLPMRRRRHTYAADREKRSSAKEFKEADPIAYCGNLGSTQALRIRRSISSSIFYSRIWSKNVLYFTRRANARRWGLDRTIFCREHR